MGTNIAPLSLKLLRDYDLNRDGKIKDEEVGLFTQDCKKLYEQAYGKESVQYKNLLNSLQNIKISFFKRVTPNVKTSSGGFVVMLPTDSQNGPLKKSEVPLGFMAGVLLHESEHVQQKMKIKEVLANLKNKGKEEIWNAVYYDKEGNREVFAEIERMNFYKKIGLKLPETNETGKQYDLASKDVKSDLATDKEAFFKEFNYSLFEKEVKKRYPELSFDVKVDPFGLKDLIGK